MENKITMTEGELVALVLDCVKQSLEPIHKGLEGLSVPQKKTEEKEDTQKQVVFSNDDVKKWAAENSHFKNNNHDKGNN